MKFEDSNFAKSLSYKLLELPFGNFYLLNRFMITEIHSEKHFGWDEVEILIPSIVNHYGEDVNIAYISNRVNSYSFDPNSWIKFEEQYGFIFAGAVVYYNQINELNATLEKSLMQNSLKRCRSLDEAINWVLNLREVKNK